MKTLAVIVVCLVGATLANELVLGTIDSTPEHIGHHVRCHQKTPVENFDMDQFMGKWYWALESPNVYSLRGNKCPVSKFHARDNGTYAYVFKWYQSGANEFSTLEGNIWQCSSTKGNGALMVEMPTRHGYWEGRLWILGTDYNNWTAAYACWFAADGQYRGWTIGWCREKNCAEQHKDSIKRVLQDHSVDVSSLESLDYSSCPDA